jgi:catechol 2,3-dioxygenase-like lactoylglutathione lyase family enzyme
MKVGDLHHVTITVSDLESSLAFYRDALELRAVADFTFDDEGHQVYMGLPKGARGRSTALRSSRPPAVGVTLVEIEPGRDGPAPQQTLEAGACMLAWELPSPADVDALHTTLTGAGYNAISEPTWAEVKGWGRVRGIAIHDPDGLLIEFYASEEAA